MTRQSISLNDNQWRFGQVPRRSFDRPDLYDLPLVEPWQPATVPGHVRLDLLALGRIPDPFVGTGYQASRWVEGVDWWYRRSLQLDSLAPEERVFVRFEGIDYLSAIFSNEREVARHEGMFAPQTVELTSALRLGEGQAELAVRLWGSSALPGRRLSWLQRLWQRLAGALHGSWVGVYPNRSATLKCQMSFGWDFAPPIRTMGLWDEVSLLITGPVFIAEASLTAQVDAPAGRETAPADLRLNLTLDTVHPRPVELQVRISPANFDGPAVGPLHFQLDLPAGRSPQQVTAHLPEVALWQPWDRGQPHRYQVELTLTDPAGLPLDQVSLRTGFRTVELEDWQIRLNGQPEFIRGLNWVPADSFPGRLRPTDYERLLGQARASGANLLRVWGGGLREKRAFYDTCDELGLLVWQEFPFACMFLGSFPRDRAYLARVEAECGAIVRQLNPHPSLALWCGGNEFSRWRNRPLLQTLAGLVERHDGSRPFVPVSPSFGRARDAHNWQVWHGDAPLQAYQAETAHFLSEFGLQAPPQVESLRTALPDPTRDWASHQADLPRLRRYAACFDPQFEPAEQKQDLTGDEKPSGNKNVIASRRRRRSNLPHRTWRLLRSLWSLAVTWPVAWTNRPPGQPTNQPFSPESLPAFIVASQRAQAAGLQTAIEHMRRRKGEAGGVCVWQFNEPWPAISWALVDYFGRPKLAYERLKDWYNPLLISLDFPVGRAWQAGDRFEAGLWAINDSLTAYHDCQVTIHLDGVVIHRQPVELPADSVRRIGRLAHRLVAPPARLSLTLHQGAQRLAHNSYDLAWVDSEGGRFSQRLRRWLADLVLR